MKIEHFDSTKNGAFIIAELSANHNGKIETAIETIKAAKASGANAIKLQTYTADTITLKSNKSYFQINGDTLWDGSTYYDLYKQAYTPWEWHEELFHVAKEEGLICFSSPFDESAVDFLEQFDPPCYKLASFEINHIPLIQYIAKKQRPIIASTGIASLEDIDLLISSIQEVSNAPLTLLKCTSAYPAPVEDANLKNILFLQDKYDVTVGLSDHTMGANSAIAAVVLGAKVIEKHFILDRSLGGPDAAFSMEPQEFSQMVNSIREVEASLGEYEYTLTHKAKKGRMFSRSIFVNQDIKKGEVFTLENIKVVRPNDGLHPKYFYEIFCVDKN